MENTKKRTRLATPQIIIITVAFIALSLWFWFFTIPALIIFFLFRKNLFEKKINYIISGVLIIVSLVSGIYIIYNRRAPILTLTSPATNEILVEAGTYKIEGTVAPRKSEVKVGYEDVEVDSKGKFIYEVELPKEKNMFEIGAWNNTWSNYNEVKESITITRLYTAEEQAEMASVEADKKAEEQAELEAYYKTKAGKICKDHVMWERDDCERIANGDIWIGMDVQMLKYQRGLADSVNTSDYGDGEQVQVCWYDYSPSCFYFKNNGSKVDAYN